MRQSGPARPVPIGRLGPLLLAGHLSWALPANAAVASILATGAAGALSDHTRSRHGRRKPWILGGALVARSGCPCPV